MDETQALFADDDSSSVNVKELLVFGLARSRYLVLFLVLLGAAGGVLVAAMEPNTYSSTAKLILRVGQREKMNAEVGTGLVDVQGGSSRSTVHMSDEMHLLNDPAITQLEDADFRDLYAVFRRWIAEKLPQVGPA